MCVYAACPHWGCCGSLGYFNSYHFLAAPSQRKQGQRGWGRVMAVHTVRCFHLVVGGWNGTQDPSHLLPRRHHCHSPKHCPPSSSAYACHFTDSFIPGMPAASKVIGETLSLPHIYIHKHTHVDGDYWHESFAPWHRAQVSSNYAC